MLSRNLYEIDEVVAALQLSLRNRWPRALFWLWELISSDEKELARQTLTNSWLSSCAPHDLTFMDDIMTSSMNAEESVTFVRRILEAPCSRTVALMSEMATQPVRPNMTPSSRDPVCLARRKVRSEAFVASLHADESITKEEAAKFWISFDAACRQYRVRDAMWLIQAAQPLLSVDAIWSAITIAVRGDLKIKIQGTITLLRDTATRTTQILHQAVACQILCTPTAEHAALAHRLKPKIAFQLRQWSEWDAVVGRRAAREYAIPLEALHKETTRGAMSRKFTNILDVRDPIPLLTEGCAWWQHTAAQMGLVEEEGCLSFPDDAALERFYDCYFPDDLPDEWSKVDQEKSHGRGCLESAAPEPVILVREELVSLSEWRMGIHVPAKKT